MTIRLCCLLLLSILISVAYADSSVRTNPPSECTAPENECQCSEEEVEDGCIKVSLDMGSTTPWTDSRKCALKVFADDQSPQVFTSESLHAAFGYTFKRIGNRLQPDKKTPKEVVLSHPDGESVHFVFAEGESLGRPDPGFHVKMDERLMMVDAQGWACTNSPVYYDLYETDGTVRRFLATDMTNERGKLVYIADPRGRRLTPSDMGIDVVLGPDGVRQFLTPSRLADVSVMDDGYDVTVYPLQDKPLKDAATGLYPLPSVAPVKRLSVRSANGGNRAVVTLRSGDGGPKNYLFDYVRGDWSLTRPSGAQEVRDRSVKDSSVARTVKEEYSRNGELLARSEYNYVWKSWGFAATNRVEGFGDATRTTSWTYVNSGGGKGRVATELKSSGLRTEYAYDAADRIVRKTRSGAGMMTETTTYAYESVDPSDIVPPMDTRPRTIVKTLDGIECERTYYVYSALTDVVERVGMQGAPYGGTNALRTVTEYYPVAGGPLSSAAADGFVKSICREDGRLDLYDYALSSNVWTKMVTHLHEQSPSPVSGKTTRDVTLTNARGEVIETRTEAFIGEIWYTIARNRMTYNSEGKRITSENLAGQVTATAWDCCHKVSETQPDGSTTTWDYDDEGRMVASSRLIPLDMTNVTWLTTCYEYDDLGRQIATWQTNYAEQVGLPAARTRYDALGRVVARIDTLGNTTTTTYSPDGRTVSVLNPNTSTRITTRSANGSLISITGTAVTPEFHTYGILPDGTRWSRTVQGETANSPRFTRRYENLLGQTVREERSGFRCAVLATVHAYDPLGRLVSTAADYEPVVEYTYDTLGNRIATTRTVGLADPSEPLEWRKTETTSSFALLDDAVWLSETSVVSCSDELIAPQTTATARQMTGLSYEQPLRVCTTDVRDNVTEEAQTVADSAVTTSKSVPYATNKPSSLSRYGVELQTISVSAVTNTYAYDALGHQIANIDGRGNTTHTEYNKRGQRSASIDELGNRTTYVYDQFSNLAAVTNPLGHATIYEYDIRGRKTYEGGATYPVRYTYDAFGNKTTMMTYRDESLGPDSGDVTTWHYDEASGLVTNKVYADGLGPKYEYDAKGNLTKRIWARGVETFYSYDGWGSLTNTSYSDGTPTVSFVYDHSGNIASAVTDGVATNLYAYSSDGLVTNEVQNGTTLARTYDSLGRPTGYTLMTPSALQREVSCAYDLLGRLSTVASGTNVFTYSYLPGTDLVSGYTCGGFSRTIAYETCRDLVSAITNRFGSRAISMFEYTNDAAGRRTAITRGGEAMGPLSGATDAYGYNGRNEVVSARRTLGGSPVAGFDEDFAYDPAGNRISATDYDETGTARTSIYAANNLNQYTSRTVPGWASVRGLANADATVAVNGSPAYMVGRAAPSAPNPDDIAYFFGSDDFDNSAGGGFAELEVSASVSDGTNDFVSVVTNKVFVPPANETYAYDADGNMTEDARFKYYWNGENRMVRAEEKSAPPGRQPYVIAYAYDHMGRNVIKDGTKLIWDDYNIIVEDAASSNATFNTWGLDFDGTMQGAGGVGGLLAVEKGDAAYLPAYDANGNVTEYVDADGVIAAHYAYSLFGKLLMAEDPVGFSHRFSTKPYCEKTRLIEFEFREYALNVGRWCNRDVVEFANQYPFVYNSVLAYYEFLGLYGNPIIGPDGRNWGPASPYDPGGAFYPKDNWYENLPDCPCSIPIQPGGCPEPSGAGDGWSAPDETDHEGGSWEIRSDPNSEGSGQQCVYDSAGNLINQGSGAGTPDRYSPSGDWLKHVLVDGIPYWVNKILQGKEKAEQIDHATHPPNQGRGSNGDPCPPNDGSGAPKPKCNPCK